MKTFINHKFPPITQINNKFGRVYLTADGNKYPSVTTVVGMHKQKELKAWRDRVGQDEAAQITKRAGLRGSAVDKLCEQYITDGNAVPSDFDADIFNSMVPHLEQINNIHCMKVRMQSNILKVAGEPDIICEYNKQSTVLDFKTSLRIKKAEWIESYFMQCAAYALMFWEATQIVIPQITIVMGVDNEDCQIFLEPVKPWLQKFKLIRQEYFDVNGI